MLCRQQDEELDELSASVERIGGVGLTIHEELLSQVSLYILKKSIPIILRKLVILMYLVIS